MANGANGKVPHMVIEGIDLSFGGAKAITDISFTVYKGEICAVIGPNGAGKSSMLNVINGVYTPQQGTITYEGKKFAKMKPHSAAVMGIGRTFQNIALFSGMTTVENIMTGRNLMMKSTFIENALGVGRSRREELEHREAVEESLNFWVFSRFGKSTYLHYLMGYKSAWSLVELWPQNQKCYYWTNLLPG